MSLARGDVPSCYLHDGRVTWSLVAMTALASGGCGSRPSYWDSNVGTPTAQGLANGVALVDDANHRAVLLTAEADQQLSRASFSVGHQVRNVVASPDGKRLFVLSTGDWPRHSAGDERPSLTVIDTSSGATPTRYPLPEPLPDLAIDPQGRYAVAYAGAQSTSASFVQNPNEIVLFDLKPSSQTDSPNPVSRSIRSFGGSPSRLTFTPELCVHAAISCAGKDGAPAPGQRRLLLIESDIDVTLLDLDHAFLATPPAEITVRLTSGASARVVAPRGLAVDGYDMSSPGDARIALRTDDSNVFTILLGPSTGTPNDFAPTINLTDVGGAPSSIAFVHTDQGLRVAALVPSASNAVLVEPDTSLTTQIALPAPYASMSLVTSVVDAASTAPSGTDTALLWGSATGSGVAFWTLGKTVGQPYRSIEVLPDVTQPIRSVHDVPGKNPQLKVLELSQGSGFLVLDLLARTASPLHTAQTPTLAISPDGSGMWAFAPDGTDLARISFPSLTPLPLTTDLSIQAVYDVARRDGGRALVAIHSRGTLGATVFDADNPDTATARRVPALLLEGP